MAIANTILFRCNVGNRKIIGGKSIISGDVATGEIDVPLTNILMFKATTNGSAQKGVVVNKTFPLVNTDVTLINESNNATTYWWALGY